MNNKLICEKIGKVFDTFEKKGGLDFDIIKELSKFTTEELEKGLQEICINNSNVDRIMDFHKHNELKSPDHFLLIINFLFFRLDKYMAKDFMKEI